MPPCKVLSPMIIGSNFIYGVISGEEPTNLPLRKISTIPPS